MTEAEIIRSTYFDSCTVYRPVKTKVNGETVHLKGLDGEVVYKDVPCALSSKQGGKANQSPSSANVDADYTLYTHPTVRIEPNDTVVVICMEQKIICTAGLSMRYTSHNNTPLKLVKEG